MVGEDSKSKKGDEFLLSNVSAEGEPLDPARIALSGLRTELAQFQRLGIVPAQFRPGSGNFSTPVVSVGPVAIAEANPHISKAQKDLKSAQEIIAASTDPVEALKSAEHLFKLAIKEADSLYQVQKPLLSEEFELLTKELKASQNENLAAFSEFETALGQIPDRQALKMFHFVQAFISMPPNDQDSKPTAAILDRHGLLKVSQGLVRANVNAYRANEKIANLKVRASSAELDRVRTREAYVEALKHAGQIALAMRFMTEMPDIWADRIFKDTQPESTQPERSESARAPSVSTSGRTTDRRKPRGTPV
jgi:hypothetical protein